MIDRCPTCDREACPSFALRDRPWSHAKVCADDDCHAHCVDWPRHPHRRGHPRDAREVLTMTDKCKTFVARWDHAVCSTCSEEHDRPAPTPTPDPLATVRAALDVASKATTGEWECEPVDVFGTLTEWSALIGPRRPGSDWPRKSDLRHEDAAAIAALHNAAPAIAELCAEVERLRRYYDAAGPEHNLLALLDLYHEREQAAIAKLAEAKRLGLEACSIGRACVKADCNCRIGAIRAALEAL